MTRKENDRQALSINKQVGSDTTKNQVVIPMSNVYVQTVFKLFKRYLIEEATGQGITADVRLANLLGAARKLHSVERKAIINGSFFGKFDETNTELVFTV
jgi:nicotinate-nucleotide pyrophosphorylase